MKKHFEFRLHGTGPTKKECDNLNGKTESTTGIIAKNSVNKECAQSGEFFSDLYFLSGNLVYRSGTLVSSVNYTY